MDNKILPFFLLMMTAIASILTLNTLKKSDNLKFITLGLIVSVLVFYFNNLSGNWVFTDFIFSKTNFGSGLPEPKGASVLTLL